jgi:hypothetical protein
MTTPTRTPHEILDELRDRYGMDEVAEVLSPRVAEAQ